MRSTLFAGVLCFSLAAAGIASGQDGLTMNLMPSYANSVVNTTVRDSMLGVDSFRNRPSTVRRPSATYGAMPRFAPAGSAASASTRYSATPAVTEKVKRQFVQWVSERSKSDADTVGRDLAKTDLVRAWSGVVSQDGLRPGDVADAMAAYWIINWTAATGKENDRAQAMAVREQVRPMIAANPAFARLNMAQRQEMAEVLMLNFLYQRDTLLHALKTHDQDLQRRAADAALTRFRNEMGVDLRALALTDRGFVRAG